MVLEGAKIVVWTMKTQLAALKLEILGMRHSSGRSIYAHIKKTYGIKGTKQRVYEQFAAYIEQKELELC